MKFLSINSHKTIASAALICQCMFIGCIQRINRLTNGIIINYTPLVCKLTIQGYSMYAVRSYRQFSVGVNVEQALLSIVTI